MKFDSLKERMEYFKDVYDYKLTPNSYVICHVDGKSFSKNVKKRFTLPFDVDLINMMNIAASDTCKSIQGCKLAYVQSDEVSLVITDFDTPDTDSFFGYRLCKLQSIIASTMTSYFNKYMIEYLVKDCTTVDNVNKILSEYKPLQFDCKAWVVPSYNDVFAWLKYRQNDCIRNSKNQAAQTYLPHKSLVGKDSDEVIELLLNTKGINWHTDYNNGMKYGRFIFKENIVKNAGTPQECVRSVYEAHSYPEQITRELFDSLNIVPKRED